MLFFQPWLEHLPGFIVKGSFVRSKWILILAMKTKCHHRQ